MGNPEKFSKVINALGITAEEFEVLDAITDRYAPTEKILAIAVGYSEWLKVKSSSLDVLTNAFEALLSRGLVEVVTIEGVIQSGIPSCRH